MSAGRWQDIPGVEISIVGNGEDIVYREGGREYWFQISCIRHPLLLFIGSYRDGKSPASKKKRLTDEERSRLVPRLVAYLGCKGDPVEVRDE